VHTGFLYGDLRERDNLQDLVVDGEGNIKVGLQEVEWGWHGLDCCSSG
jgi:hypothetical protein